MTRSTRSSRNSARAALLCCSLILSLAGGCDLDVSSTYEEATIPHLVKQICKDEYNLDVSVLRTPTTLWIYAPVTKILHKDYGVKEDKILDDELVEKLRNILTTAGRVLLSADKAPEFFAVAASDTTIGLDYMIIGNVADIRKSHNGAIPWTEANRRYVLRFKLAPDAVGDTTGAHLHAYDIRLPDFLAEQIAQRIGALFQGESLKSYFKVEKSDGIFVKGLFFFVYTIRQTAPPPEPIDITAEVTNLAAYCIQSYEFRDFSGIVFSDLANRDRSELTNEALWAHRPSVR